MELVKTKEALAQTLKDHTHDAKEARRWSLIGDYFYKKATRWEPLYPPTPPGSPAHLSSNSEDFGDDILKKLDEEIVKQKGDKK